MTSTDVPEDGELRISSVSLPAGRRISAGSGSGGPVAWATTEPVPDAGRIWAALSQAHAQSGLVPFLLSGLFPGSTGRPWDQDEFGDPADVTTLDRMDAAVLLREWWDGQTTEADDEADEDFEEEEDFAEYLAQTLGPFPPRPFPGLAPAQDRQLGSGHLDQVLRALGPARIGLVPAGRPADALPAMGWDGAANHFRNALPIAAVLRSWEDRFGARLLRVGFAEISVLAQRPPRTLEPAQRLAAEQWAFCDECAGEGLADIPSITQSLMNSPIWTFWWD